MMGLAVAKTLLFSCVVAAPLLALTAGEAPPYGSPHPEYPALVDFASDRGAGLELLAEALLHRSYVTKLAVTAKNWAQFSVFNFVDTPRVISGARGWLFYKPEFFGGRCQPEAQIVAAARSVDMLHDLADSANIALTISLSPDKSVIYPEKLNRRLRRYWACKAKSAELLREHLAASAPSVVDHAAVLLDHKTRHAERMLYFSTDTHWTPYGAGLALRQLVASMRPDQSQLPEPVLTGDEVLRQTDLRNGMLALSEQEAYVPIDAEREREVFDTAAFTRSTVILHDSFYGTVERDLTTLFPNSVAMRHDDTGATPLELGSAEALVVNSVERLFVWRALNASLSSGGVVANALLARNRQLAEKCTFEAQAAGDSALPSPLSLHDAVLAGGHYEAEGSDPQFVVGIPDVADPATELACVRVEVAGAEGGQLELFLPGKVARRARFEAGRSIVLTLKDGVQTVSLVLPRYTLGKALRIDLGDAPAPQAVLRGVQFGRVRT